MIAGYFRIPEVAIFEGNKLIRAVRAKRNLQNKLISSNYPFLLKIENQYFNIDWSNVYPYSLTPKKFSYSSERND